MVGSIAAARLAALVGGFDRSPAYAGLADGLRLLIGDGRVGLDLRLPSERDLSVALGVSRTTVTRAYAGLVESGFAQARQGSGTYTRLPGGRRRSLDRTLTPTTTGDDVIDLNCATHSALPGVGTAYAEAVQELPRYLGGHGYFPTGLPALQEAVAASYDARGLPTDPEQIMVVPGSLSALAVVAQGLVRRGDRDLDAVGRLVHETRPTLAYLIPDFQNPTGNLMSDAQRERLAAALRLSGTVPIVDEAHQALVLDGRPMPRPFAAFAPASVTLGSTSKSFWGGLRIGWVRCPEGVLERLMEARVALDLGSPVLEQLVAARLLDRREELWTDQRRRLREQRDALAEVLRTELPDWRFRLPPGGLSLWCELPSAGGVDRGATALVLEAERRGVLVSPGSVFAVDGGLDSFVRVPFTRPADELRTAVTRLRVAWSAVGDHATRTTARGGPTRNRVMVA
jgi:DNA-binding transcriptional MocR family regulator